ncbi:type VI secretion system tip protein VgrG [Burkholderia cepacia]|uniref:type VI secretion system Vgr family protein n=1 Tax=Burkholderia cepacia TaxID=292 RepID=UPI0007598FCE|nr:type VI secretion system tip protein VgrG [Burkholderia cepacia]KVE85542.1 type IV secretion protein Rhs [Burkholderia cepacia]RRA18665.1 type VI secretion system tip protein VgrG [Burkholderia cepacia]
MQLSDIPSFFQLQSNRLFSIDTPLKGRSELVLVNFTCTESLSDLFHIDTQLASQDRSIELKKMIGQPVTITLQLTDAIASSEERYFNGYVVSFSHLDTDGGFTKYSAVIKPWLWMLSRHQDIRIYQEKTTQDILAKLFHEYGSIATFEFRLSKATRNRSYCTQYKETDLEFVQRLMQEDGLFYFFEHTKSGHKLIITDNSIAAKPIDGTSPNLEYSKGEARDDLAIVTSFSARRQLESNKVGVKTYDYKAPGARRFVSGNTGVDQGNVPTYEIYDYVGEHGFPNSDRGEELARFRTQALAAHSKIFVGTTTSRRMMPARYFQLEEHYDHDDGKQEDRQFLITSVIHSGSNNYQAGEGAATYGCSFTCIRKKIPYRPAFTIVKPTIIGPQTAVVVGPKGEEIYTDNLGRVKVQFPWDRLGESNQSSSCWVRVGQPWAGGGFGMVNIPRIGDEVVVIFLDGDPDRPLIISRVYNAANMPPWDLPANASQSGILSRSTKGGSVATANAIRFEDKKGSEEVWLHAEKDQRLEVEHDESHWVGNNRTKNIDHDETVHVKHDRTETVDNNETITIGVDRTEHVGNNETLTVGGNRNETIQGMENLLIALTSTETVGLAKALTVGGGYQVTVAGAVNTTAGLASAEEVGLSKTSMVGQSYTIKAGKVFEVTVGKSTFRMDEDGNITLKGVKLLIEGSGPIEINGKDVDVN